jgi:hypothetical protein
VSLSLSCELWHPLREEPGLTGRVVTWITRIYCVTLANQTYTYTGPQVYQAVVSAPLCSDILPLTD